MGYIVWIKINGNYITAIAVYRSVTRTQRQPTEDFLQIFTDMNNKMHSINLQSHTITTIRRKVSSDPLVKRQTSCVRRFLLFDLKSIHFICSITLICCSFRCWYIFLMTPMRVFVCVRRRCYCFAFDLAFTDPISSKCTSHSNCVSPELECRQNTSSHLIPCNISLTFL